MFEPYKWQKECLEKWKENKKRGVIEVATGAGKTSFAIMAALSVLEEYPETSVFILVPQTALIHQWKNALVSFSFAPEHIGEFSGDKKRKEQLTVMVINTARNYLPKIVEKELKKEKNCLIIADECHHYTASVNEHVFDYELSPFYNISKVFTLGLTATAGSAHKRNILDLHLGPIFFDYTNYHAIEDGIISDFTLVNVALALTNKETERYNNINEEIVKFLGILKKRYPLYFPKNKPLNIPDILERMLKSRDPEVVEDAERLNNLYKQRSSIIANADNRISCSEALVKNLPVQKKIIIFMERISQAEELYDRLLTDFPYQMAIYHSKLTPERRQRELQSFRNNEKRILISCRALDEGLDIPNADIGILLSNTNQNRQRIQRTGRLLRKSEEKEKPCIYYLYADNTVERPILLDDIPEAIDKIKLLFDDNENFRSLDYYQLAEKLLERTKHKATTEQLVVLRKALSHGIALPDYLDSPEELKRRIKNSFSPSYRLYLQTMHALATIRIEAETKNLL